MNIFTVLCASALFMGLSLADDKVLKAKFDTEENHLILDDTVIRKFHRLPGFISTYGEPDRKKVDADGISQKHYYESLGIVLDVRYGSIRGITFRFGSRIDSSLTESTFKGILKVDNVVLDANTEVSDLKKVKYFECGRPGACYPKAFGTEINVFAMFDKSGKKRLSHVSFVY